MTRNNWKRLFTIAGLMIVSIQSLPALSWFFPITKRIFPKLMGADQNYISLTFDDGPDPASTQKILDLLDAAKVKATFFMLGEMVKQNPSVAQAVASAGHQIALHGYEHRNHLFRSPRTIAYDMQKAKSLIENVTGQEITFMRPPYGVISIGTIIAARRLNLKIRLWTSWGRDWRANATPSSVFDDLARHGVKNGCILLHDSDCTSSPGSTWSTIGALKEFLAYVKTHDVTVTTLSLNP